MSLVNGKTKVLPEGTIAEIASSARNNALSTLGYGDPRHYSYGSMSRLYTVAYNAIVALCSHNVDICFQNAREKVIEHIKRNPGVLQPAERFKPVVTSFENANRFQS